MYSACTYMYVSRREGELGRRGCGLGLQLTLKTGTFPKKAENLLASIVADVTTSFRSFLRDTTCKEGGGRGEGRLSRGGNMEGAGN